MDLFTRIKKYMARGKSLPWDYGLIENPSEKARLAWTVLTSTEKLMISRHSPFGRGRIRKLEELYRQGLSLDVLTEISGVHRSTLSRNLPRLRGTDEGRK